MSKCKDCQAKDKAIKLLTDAGNILYQALSDWGRLSNPESKKFIADQKFKESILTCWESTKIAAIIKLQEASK